MPQGFVSVWFTGCRAAFRNKQALHRHQKKSGYTGNTQTEMGSTMMSTGRESIKKSSETVIERDQITTEVIESIFDESSLCPSHERSLDDIIDLISNG
jgi:hypothetical protein